MMRVNGKIALLLMVVLMAGMPTLSLAAEEAGSTDTSNTNVTEQVMNDIYGEHLRAKEGLNLYADNLDVTKDLENRVHWYSPDCLEQRNRTITNDAIWGGVIGALSGLMYGISLLHPNNFDGPGNEWATFGAVIFTELGAMLGAGSGLILGFLTAPDCHPVK